MFLFQKNFPRNEKLKSFFRIIFGNCNFSKNSANQKKFFKKLLPFFFAISLIFVKFSDIIENTFCQSRRNGGIFPPYFLTSFGKTFEPFRHSLRLAERDLQGKFLFCFKNTKMCILNLLSPK